MMHITAIFDDNTVIANRQSSIGKRVDANSPWTAILACNVTGKADTIYLSDNEMQALMYLMQDEDNGSAESVRCRELIKGKFIGMDADIIPIP